MARKKLRRLSAGQRRRLRRRQLIFAVVAVLVIASFLVSLISLY